MLDNGRFELLLVDPQQFIDLEFNVLSDPKPLGVEIHQRSKMKENIVAKVLAANEPELAIGNDGNDLPDTHLWIPWEALYPPYAAVIDPFTTL